MRIDLSFVDHDIWSQNCILKYEPKPTNSFLGSDLEKSTYFHEKYLHKFCLKKEKKMALDPHPDPDP